MVTNYRIMLPACRAVMLHRIAVDLDLPLMFYA
jgi:hypothetical protein